MSYDPVLDHHVYGDDDAKEAIIDVFENQSVPAHWSAITRNYSLPIDPFNGAKPWANRATRNVVNRAIRDGMGGRGGEPLNYGAIAHSWVRPVSYLLMWRKVASVLDDDALYQRIEQRLPEDSPEWEPPEAVRQTVEQIKWNPEAVRTPCILLEPDGGLNVEKPDGIDRAAAMALHTGSDDERLMPLYIFAARPRPVPEFQDDRDVGGGLI